MSHKADRERAESGEIFRNGRLWKKEDWYAIHPTQQMRAEQQAVVSDAVKDEMATKFTLTNYICTKCNREHRVGSKIYEQHTQYKA